LQTLFKRIFQKSLGYNCVVVGDIAIFHNLGFHPQPYANLSLLDGDTTSLMNPLRILWKYVQSQRYLLGLDSQGCQKLACALGMFWGTSTSLKKFGRKTRVFVSWGNTSSFGLWSSSWLKESLSHALITVWKNS